MESSFEQTKTCSLLHRGWAKRLGSDPAVVEAFKVRQTAIFARLQEMGKKPTPHASDILLDSVA